jgi:hypothetical protein
MSENQNQLAVRPRASQILATLVGMEPNAMLDTIKAQCFKGNPANISDSQLAAFVSIAAEMGVNPLLPGMLYAYPSSGGSIVPMMGPDAVFKKLTEHKDVESWEVAVFPEDVTQPPTHAVAKIYRRSTEKPLVYTAVLSEWKIGANPNWNSRPRHMLSLRAIKQCARQVIHGIPFDEDERVMMDAINVTPGGEAPPVRPPAPERKKRGAATVQENVQEAEVTTTPEPQKAAEQPKIEKLAEKLAQPAEAEKVAAVVQSFEQAAKATDAEPRKVVQTDGAVRTESAPEVATRLGEPVAPLPRAFLKDGETLETEISVSEVGGLNITTAEGVKPSIKAKVKGGYVGEIYHVGGGTAGPDGKAQVKAPWSVGESLKVVLLGKLNNKAKNENGTLGKVQVFVQSVEISQEGMEA